MTNSFCKNVILQLFISASHPCNKTAINASGLDPKMLPVVHTEVSSQLRNGRAHEHKYFFFSFSLIKAIDDALAVTVTTISLIFMTVSVQASNMYVLNIFCV